MVNLPDDSDHPDPEEDQGMDESEVYGLAIRWLSRREYASGELVYRLIQKGAERVVAQQVLERLQSDNYQSDQRFTEIFVRSRVGRYYGPIRIRADLGSRGVSESIIDAELATYNQQWQQLAVRWVEKKGVASDQNQKKKRYRQLMNRGFSHAQAMAAVFSRS